MKAVFSFISTWRVAIICIIAIIVIFIACNSKEEIIESQADNASNKYFTSITVEEGDTLWGIAQEFMTEEYANENAYIEEVMSINHLKSDLIVEGTHLVVPYYEVRDYDE